MNTKKSVVAKRRKAFPKTSIKFEKRFKQIFYFPEIARLTPFPSPRDFFRFGRWQHLIETSGII